LLEFDPVTAFATGVAVYVLVTLCFLCAIHNQEDD
jgi:hypothetical protein